MRSQLWLGWLPPLAAGPVLVQDAEPLEGPDATVVAFGVARYNTSADPGAGGGPDFSRGIARSVRAGGAVSDLAPR